MKNEIMPEYTQLLKDMEAVSYSREPKLKIRDYIAVQLLQGFISSGRKSAVIDSKEISLEAAALYHTDRLIDLLSK